MGDKLSTREKQHSMNCCYHGNSKKKNFWSVVIQNTELTSLNSTAYIGNVKGQCKISQISCMKWCVEAMAGRKCDCLVNFLSCMQHEEHNVIFNIYIYVLSSLTSREKSYYQCKFLMTMEIHLSPTMCYSRQPNYEQVNLIPMMIYIVSCTLPQLLHICILFRKKAVAAAGGRGGGGTKGGIPFLHPSPPPRQRLCSPVAPPQSEFYFIFCLVKYLLLVIIGGPT